MRLLPLLTAALVAGGLAAPVAVATANPCAPWTVTVLASGLGSLENVEPDGNGGLFLSATGGVERFTRTGGVRLVTAATSPGGLRVHGGALFFNTGDALQSGALGSADGTIQRLDLKSGKRTTWAAGLTMPNGLVLLPDGSALTSRDLTGGHPTGITRVADHRRQESWSNQPDSNGMAVDPTGRWLYSDETFTAASNVYRTEIAHPTNRQVVVSLAAIGAPKGLDDLTLATSGTLYLAANGAGQVIRLDPRTKASCVVAAGLHNTSAVKQGRGGSFPMSRLYVTGFDGRLLELTPPAGVTP